MKVRRPIKVKSGRYKEGRFNRLPSCTADIPISVDHWNVPRISVWSPYASFPAYTLPTESRLTRVIRSPYLKKIVPVNHVLFFPMRTDHRNQYTKHLTTQYASFFCFYFLPSELRIFKTAFLNFRYLHSKNETPVLEGSIPVLGLKIKRRYYVYWLLFKMIDNPMFSHDIQKVSARALHWWGWT